jgi:hydrogenase maturation protease
MIQHIVIMGIGNWLRSDDGVGVHAAQSLALDPPPGALVVDAGTDALSALSFLEGATHVLLIDAVRGGGEPGAIRRFTEHDLSVPQGVSTAHAVSLLASRRLMPPEAAWPEFLILGVEPASMTYGLELTPAVADALPEIVRLSREIVESWRKETSHSQPSRFP